MNRLFPPSPPRARGGPDFAVLKRLPHNATVEQAAELTPAQFAAELAEAT